MPYRTVANVIQGAVITFYTEERVGLQLDLGVISSESGNAIGNAIGNDIGNDCCNDCCSSGPRHAGQPRARGDLHGGGADLTTEHQLAEKLTRCQRIEPRNRSCRPPITLNTSNDGCLR